MGFPVAQLGEKQVFIFGEAVDVAMVPSLEQGCALLCLVDLGELHYSATHISISSEDPAEAQRHI